MKGYKMTLNKRDEPLTLADVLLIQAANEKGHMVKVITADENIK